MESKRTPRVALIEAGSPGLNIYSHVAMGRGVALLATVVHEAGYDVRAFIEDVCGKGDLDWEWIADADVVGFSAITCTMPRTAELLAEVRRRAPQAAVVFGGPEPTCNPARSFDAGADIVLRGEAELTLPRLLGTLLGRSDEPLSSIEGLMWRQADVGIAEGPPPRQLASVELDALPVVDRSLVHMADRNSVASVWRTRGCPSRCDFCEVCEIWPRYVSRSDDKSIEELMDAQDAGYQTAFLIDDNAAANKRAFKEFLQRIVDRGYEGMLVTQMRADAAFHSDGRLDRELLRLLKQAAGITVVCVGVESADDANLASLNKREDSQHMARALKAMKHYGLLVHGMFIALNTDTREIIRRDGEFARRYVTSLQYLFETPLPGTKRTAEHEAADAIMFTSGRDLELYDGMHLVLRPQWMRAEEMQQLVVDEYRRFYSAGRVALAALHGTFARHHVLTSAQRALLRRRRGMARLKQWAWYHVRYKYAPTAFLAMGRSRVRKMTLEPAYAEFVERLREDDRGSGL